MIYKSNLEAPNLQQHFPHAASRVLGHSFGHDVVSDWQDKPADDTTFRIYRECGFFTHDEAAILYAIGKEKRGKWLDIGSHTGWTAMHLAAAGCSVTAIEPMLALAEWEDRFYENTRTQRMSIAAGKMRSDEYFAMWQPAPLFDGVVIDGDHNHPYPRGDARGADNRLRPGGVILFHDAMGGPVWQGIYELLDRGYKCHMYLTPHMLACCWRDRLPWTPPEHVPDPAINWREIQTNHMKDFAWRRVSCDSF